MAENWQCSQCSSFNPPKRSRCWKCGFSQPTNVIGSSQSLDASQAPFTSRNQQNLGGTSAGANQRGADVAKRLLVGFAIGFVIYGVLRVFMSLTTYALFYYGVTLPVEISLFSPIDWTFLAILALSLLPAGIFIGYYCKEWGWILAMLLEPAWIICVSPITPFIHNLVSLSAGTGPAIEGYIDLPALLLYQLAAGGTLGFLGGTAGELLRTLLSKKQRTQQESSAQVTDSQYYKIASLRDMLKWYFRLSPTILLRVPMLLVFGGFAVFLVLANTPFVLVYSFGLSYVDRATGEIMRYGALGWLIFILEVLFVASPALILPYLWSSSVSLPKSSRIALSIAIIPVWSVVFTLIYVIEGLL